MKHVTARLDGQADAVMFAATAPQLRMLIASAQAAIVAITDGHVGENGQPLITDPRHSPDEHRVGSFQVPCDIVEVQDFQNATAGDRPTELTQRSGRTEVQSPSPAQSPNVSPQAAEEKS